MKKKILSLALALLLTLSLAPAAAAGGGPSPAITDNFGDQNYDGYRGSRSCSYLFENASGGLTRVEYIPKSRDSDVPDHITVEDYDSSFAILSQADIETELPIWGGFFAGERYNFVITGQSNENEDDSVEVIRVTRYSKDWQRLGAASLYGANTFDPFDWGSLDCAEDGDTLYIRTCHEMYADENGLNHQASMTIAVSESADTVLAASDSTSNYAWAGWISHSFSQFILNDPDRGLVGLDLGDTYPRGIILTTLGDPGSDSYENYMKVTKKTLLSPPNGSSTYQITGISLGGFEQTANAYVAAYKYDGAGASGSSKDKSVYLMGIDKGTLEPTVSAPLSSPGAMTPVLAPAGPDGGYILWNGVNEYGSISSDLYWASYDSDGHVSGPVMEGTGMISDCQPVMYNGKLTWYATNGFGIIFYTLDGSGLTACPFSGTFLDVDYKEDYYGPAIAWASRAGVTAGYPGGLFKPDGPTSRAELATFLWNAQGKPAPTVSDSPFRDVKDTDWFFDAVMWAYENGYMNGNGDGTFTPNDPCQRRMVIQTMYNYSGRPDSRDYSNWNNFDDVSPDDWSYDAMLWAIGSSLIYAEQQNGYTSTGCFFYPTQVCTRKTMVYFLYGLLQNS